MMYLGDQAVGLATSLPIFSNIAKIECGNYTPEQDTETSLISFTHSLGEMPDFLFVFADPYDLPKNSTKYLIHGYFVNWNVNDGSEQDSTTTYWYFILYTSTVSTGSLRSATLKSTFTDTTTFSFPYHSNHDIIAKANITYHYIVGKFKEVTSNANE